MSNEEILKNLFESKASRYYGDKFLQIEKRGWLVPTWNWGCFIFSGFWMLYRKLGGMWFFYILILSFGIKIIFVTYGVAGFYFFYFFIAKLIIPMYANAYMYWKVNRLISKIRSKGDDPLSPKYRNMLASISYGSMDNPNILGK